MSETAQIATPEQEAMAQAVQHAQKQAYEDVQKNMQLEIQMRMTALDKAVSHLYEGSAGEITKCAEVFLKFLKTGETVQGEVTND